MFNQYKLIAIPFVLVAATVVTGCGADVDSAVGDLFEGEDSSLLSRTENSASQSIISPNSLDPLALQPSDLGVHPLSLPGMSATTAALVTGPDGTLVRKLLSYAVGCALGAHAKFDFSWVDATGTIHPESYFGSSGIAPAWPIRALNVAEQESVSACLASRTNWYGEKVQISMRGAALGVNHDELTFFSIREGAFWGNLFSTTPFLRACYDADNVAHSRFKHRDCAAGHDENGTVLECGIIAIVGSCQQTCLAPAEDGYYPSCTVASGAFPSADQANRAITVFLYQ